MRLMKKNKTIKKPTMTKKNKTKGKIKDIRKKEKLRSIKKKHSNKRKIFEENDDPGKVFKNHQLQALEMLCYPLSLKLVDER